MIMRRGGVPTQWVPARLSTHTIVIESHIILKFFPPNDLIGYRQKTGENPLRGNIAPTTAGCIFCFGVRHPN